MAWSPAEVLESSLRSRTGDLTSKGAGELAVHAAQAGAAAVIVIPPYYEAHNLEETRKFLQDIHNASGLPIIYYNIPSISGLTLSAQNIASLSDVAASTKGSIWGAVNIIPKLSVERWNALAVEDDLKKGREVWEKIFPICIELRIWKTGGVRKPSAPLKEGPQAELAALLETARVKL
ncbi:dihydrodipicolinate synthase [Colletotrichum lupini]|uniref:Dihydrodipicolinate synthase n=1 Tax=Colletotrichum lupini TaxID=145971 RepID=A0A9Q8SNY8_9PEZI|nr:dihydrodipicolinate synthase [Colletotrichum lupini]UQC80821.1 dihydrodipicolinate synthase [Colletotrichum lupini]